MTPENKMAALFRAETPPARDFAFEAVMAQKMAARRLRSTILAMIPVTAAAAAGLWGLQPLLPLAGQAMIVAPELIVPLSATVAAGLGAGLLVWVSRRLSPA